MTIDLKNEANWLIVEDLASLRKLESEWQRLFASNPNHTPFQSWPWTVTWIRHLAGPHTLRFVCRCDETGNLTYVLPLVGKDTRKAIESREYFFACGYGPECSDYLRPLSIPDFNNHLADISAVAIDRFINRNARVILTGLDGPDDLSIQLYAAANASGRPARLMDDQRCPSVELPKTWDAYLQGLSRNSRSQIGRYYRNIGRHRSVDIHTLEYQDAPYFVKELIRLNRLRIADKGMRSSLDNPAFRAFMYEAVPALAQEGRAWMDVLTEGSTVIGAALNLLHADRVYYYMGGFDKRHAGLHPGTVLFTEVIRRSISRGHRSYDFLRGTESYKYRWGASDLITRRVDIYPRGPIRGTFASRKDELAVNWRRALRRLKNDVLGNNGSDKTA